jgi:hypothetical protein
MKIGVLKKDKKYNGCKYGFFRVVTGRKNIKSKPIYFDNLETLITHVKPILKHHNSYTFVKSINYDYKEFKTIITVTPQIIEKLGDIFSKEVKDYHHVNGDSTIDLLAYIKKIKLNSLLDKL